MNIIRYTGVAIGSIAKKVIRALLYALIGGGAVLIILGVRYLESRSDLSAWHTEKLTQEFTKDSEVKTFKEYLDLEEQLFTELDEKIYSRIDSQKQQKFNRYHKNSLTDPRTWDKNWNRSFEFPVVEPRAGVLLLHGLSDSPYSMRDIGSRLNQAGAWVLGLRIPGHGTAPSGLVETEWQDMAAAVDLAFQHLQSQVKNTPLFVVGYSNGGALAVNYALRSLVSADLPVPTRLVLLSPEIGISKLAALAVWQERLGYVLGLEKLGWQAILPEVEAFKYGSFSLNAAKQAHLLTGEIQKQISSLKQKGLLNQMPPTIAFQSVVDATISAPALVEGLFARLPEGHHELVLYDFNRYQDIDLIFKDDPSAWVDSQLSDQDVLFAVTVVTNRNERNLKVKARILRPGQETITECDIEGEWPDEVYSLSHVALPFAQSDPIYGNIRADDNTRLQLGNLALRGERGVLQIPESTILRLRWNPFYEYQTRRILHYLNLGHGVNC